MPRKQRFKPSRKPKPITPIEDAANARTTSTSQPHNDNVAARDAPSMRHEDSMTEPPSDQTSR
ncbi:MAG TPA: hypothetical protein VFT22_39295 [Kofleriaceae bacterium]|nr:hypothetical protein [Kofleriaceae bacterium]